MDFALPLPIALPEYREATDHARFGQPQAQYLWLVRQCNVLHIRVFFQCETCTIKTKRQSGERCYENQQ